MDLSSFAEEVGSTDPVTIAGMWTRGGPVDGVRCVAAPAGIEWLQADEMTVCCGAGTSVDELDDTLRQVGQRTLLPPGGTVGGALSTGRSGVRRLGDGPLRDALLQVRYVAACGAVVTAGGPTVKNVSGFDLCRLLVGSRGTLGFMGEVIVRTRPRALHSGWYTAEAHDPQQIVRRLHRPIAVLWDGLRVWALLEGHPRDVESMAATNSLVETDGPPALPPHRAVVAPSAQFDLPSRIERGTFVAELGVGVVHAPDGALPAVQREPGVTRIEARMKHQFDPTGRLNPGLVV